MAILIKCYVLTNLLNLLVANGHTDGLNGSENEDSAPKKKLTLSFDDYKALSNTLIVYMRNEEVSMEIGDSASGSGIKRSGLINWYLEKIVDQIESEEELLEKKALVEKVIDRLMYHVCVLCYYFYFIYFCFNISFFLL